MYAYTLVINIHTHVHVCVCTLLIFGTSTSHAQIIMSSAFHEAQPMPSHAAAPSRLVQGQGTSSLQLAWRVQSPELNEKIIHR